MAGINSTNLYITSNQIVLKSDPNNLSTWQDLYRLLPNLRKSLCCVVCGNLLIDPQTPTMDKCQHHLCRKCKGGKKRIEPACVFCKYSKKYTENKTVRTLLQCYKKMCIMLINSEIYQRLVEQASQSNIALSVKRGASNLVMLIKEGAAFQDDNQTDVGLSTSVDNTLPCTSSTKSSTQTLQLNKTDKTRVMYAGSGKKITIKRKPKGSSTGKKIKRSQPVKKDSLNKENFKKQSRKRTSRPYHGCRCGSTTVTLRKLNCFGQRCPCYAETKPCMECKCRSCGNPHLPDGSKVRPNTRHTEIFQPLSLADSGKEQQLQLEKQPLLQNVELDLTSTIGQIKQHLMVSNIKVLDSYKKIPTSLPHAILANDSETTDDEDEEITADG